MLLLVICFFFFFFFFIIIMIIIMIIMIIFLFLLLAVLTGGAIEDAEEVVVGAGHDLRVVAAPRGLKLIKYTVVFIQVAELGPQVLVHVERLHWPRLHVDVPHLVPTRKKERKKGGKNEWGTGMDSSSKGRDSRRKSHAWSRSFGHYVPLASRMVNHAARSLSAGGAKREEEEERRRRRRRKQAHAP